MREGPDSDLPRRAMAQGRSLYAAALERMYAARDRGDARAEVEASQAVRRAVQALEWADRHTILPPPGAYA